jgi:hypothetical protein
LETIQKWKRKWISHIISGDTIIRNISHIIEGRMEENTRKTNNDATGLNGDKGWLQRTEERGM